MANTASNVLVGAPLVTGGLYLGDLIGESEYPTSATSELPDGLEGVGYLSEDGVTEANGRDTEQIKAWGGSTVRRVQNDHTVTYAFTFLESKNAAVLRAVYGEGNVTTSGGGVLIRKNAIVLPRMSFCFEMLDGADRIRNFVPIGQVVETGDVTYVHSDVIRYEVTVEAYEDPNGDKALMFIAPANSGGGGGA